jgi:phosphinothricin acetyltransferase
VTESSISFETEPPSAAEMAERIRKAHLWLVAERDGEIVGYAYGGRHRDRAAYNSTVEVSAYVDRSAHRTGLGRSLYTELFDRLKERGFRLLVAGITLPNEASVGIHEALGFEPVGVYKNVGFKNGEWWDVGWWQLDLGEPE